MPWRLIVFIIVLAVFLGFIGLNLSNTSNLSFGFKEFTNVPVYLTIFISFALGLISSLPFIIFGSVKKRIKQGKAAQAAKAAQAKEASGTSAENTPAKTGSYGID
jgi:uncharacterized membrane protein YciS (DUF1049 family)